MATDAETVRARICSVCAGDAFSFIQAQTPFDFSKQPTGQIDKVFRVTMDSDRVVGGLNFTEERTDRIVIWVARKQAAAPQATYAQLLTDASALRAAVIRDGALAGDYAVPDGGAGMSIDHETGYEYAVLRLTLPVNYEVAL